MSADWRLSPGESTILANDVSVPTRELRWVGALDAMPGFIYGLKQGAVIGELLVGRDVEVDYEALGRTLAIVADGFDETEMMSWPPASHVAERVAQLAIAIQRYLGHPVSEKYFAERVEGPERASFRCLVPAHDPRSAKAVVDWLTFLIRDVIEKRTDDANLSRHRRRFERLSSNLKNIQPEALNSFNLILSAWELDVPVSRIADNIYRFGIGCHARMLDSSFTDRTSAIAATLAKNKYSTARILRQAGIPAPEQLIASSTDEAVTAARRLGYPVVVKPIKEDGGSGVSANLRNDAMVIEAVAEAQPFGNRFIVERHFDGRDYRITVHEGEVIKAEERVAGGVVGDGAASVVELLGQLQQTPRHRHFHHRYGHLLLALDAEARSILEEQGLSANSIVAEGHFVPLRRKNNVSTGGNQILVPLRQVHPDNLALAVRCADLVGLDLAGVDLLIPDISVSWYETGACICEVNAKPQVGKNTTPLMYVELLKRLVEEKARIPIHLVIAADGEEARLSELFGLMRDLNCNALATPLGLWIDERKLAAKPTNGFHAARIILGERTATGMLCVVPIAEIAGLGLPFDWFDSIRPSLRCRSLGTLASAIKPHTSYFSGTFGGA
jgi:cyanophycin synthetase